MVERLLATKEKEKKEMNATCKSALEEFNKINDNFPIVLEKVTFNVFSHHMSTKKSKKYGGYLSATSYGGVLNALTHIYHIGGNKMDGYFKKELFQFMSGMKGVLAANERQSGTSLDEENKAMSFEVYKILF